jgi:hypothetical protein
LREAQRHHQPTNKRDEENHMSIMPAATSPLPVRLAPSVVNPTPVEVQSETIIATINMSVSQDITGVMHVGSVQIEKGFNGQMVWTIDPTAGAGVTFAQPNPIMFVTAYTDGGAKQFPGGMPTVNANGTTLTLAWHNNESQFF